MKKAPKMTNMPSWKVEICEVMLASWGCCVGASDVSALAKS